MKKTTLPNASVCPWHITLLGVVLLSLLNGCVSTPNQYPYVPVTKVTLGSGDVVDVKFLYMPTLNESQTIRPDGMISLHLVGEIRAEGLTPGELRLLLLHKYSLLVEKAEVSVVVRQLVNRVVYVSGAVLRPGRYDMPGRLTALEAIMSAGGLNLETARQSNVLVIRQEKDKYQGYSLDLRNVLSGKEEAAFVLQAQDVVYVPRTRIVNVNQWIAQHINSMIPQFGVRVTTQSGDVQYSVDTTDFRR